MLHNYITMQGAKSIKVKIFCWFNSSLEHCCVCKHWIAQISQI